MQTCMALCPVTAYRELRLQSVNIKTARTLQVKACYVVSITAFSVRLFNLINRDKYLKTRESVSEN